jgi:hypothetical protein
MTNRLYTILKDLVSIDLLKLILNIVMIVKWIHKILLHYIKIDDNFSEIDIDIEFGSYLTKEQNLSKNRNYKNNKHYIFYKVDLVGYQIG